MTLAGTSDRYRYVSVPVLLEGERVHAERKQGPHDAGPRVELWVGELYLCVDDNTAREIRAALEGVLDGVSG